MFTMLPPGGKLGQHRDPFAGALRYHLGIDTPNSDDCWIRIDDQFHSWRDGQGIVFDETFIHSAKNDTDHERIILFCDITRPLRGAIPRAINRFFIRYVVKAGASRNVPTEKVGGINRAFEKLVGIQTFGRRLKKKSEPAYYTIKYSLMAGIAYLILFY
jgi:beta-hydroxylase